MIKKVIQLELNEISKDIIDKMIGQGRLKNFNYLNTNFKYFTTSSDLKYENIEPWIQWVSAHTGKTFQEHQIFHLGDVDNLHHPQVWDVLADNGVKSAIISSMNSKKSAVFDGFFFPDPWAKDGKAYPNDLQSLWNLVSSKVQVHATDKLKLSDVLNGLKCCNAGLSLVRALDWTLLLG